MQRPFFRTFAACTTLACLAAPALADGATSATAAVADCPLIGAASGLTAECDALRVTFHTGVTDCMQDLTTQARARITDGATNGSHTNRARMLICDRQVRDRMGLVD